MEDSIKSSAINNRKIVIEIRYEPNPTVIDSRGLLVKKLVDAKLIPEAQWQMGIGEVKIADTLKAETIRQVIYADLHRLSIISSKIESNESFFHFVDKIFKIFKEVIPSFTIIRIGCRIQGTYSCKSDDHSKIVSNFKALFPSQILLEDYNIKDLRLQLNYQNGQYNIGPVNKEDPFIKTEFPYDEARKNIGFGIDTDNFVIRGKEKEIIKDTVIKDVYLTSLSIEKSLFEKLNTL
jgi:hypothetical protein